MNQFTKLIAAQLNLKEQAVENTLALLEEGCTIPFISRYRKEKTGNMDEVNIEAIAQANEKLSEMAKRKETILKTIEEQGKLSGRSEEHTSELQSHLNLVCRLLLEKNFFNDTATTEIYTLSLHDALPI